MKDLTNGKLNEALEFAKKIGDDSLQKCLDRLLKREANGNEVVITTDFAPLSFYFECYRAGEFNGNGGIIYHGHHDNGGDGGAPTFSVNLTPVNGWGIHT